MKSINKILKLIKKAYQENKIANQKTVALCRTAERLIDREVITNQEYYLFLDYLKIHTENGNRLDLKKDFLWDRNDMKIRKKWLKENIKKTQKSK